MTRSEFEQAANDTEVKAALDAWRKRDPGLSLEDADALWDAAWTALDFSWAGLADAGWSRGDAANEAQKLKRWRAPASFPGAGDLRGAGEAAWRESNLQEYWR